MVQSVQYYYYRVKKKCSNRVMLGYKYTNPDIPYMTPIPIIVCQAHASQPRYEAEGSS